VLCTGSNLARHSTMYVRTVGAARRQAVRGEELYRTAPEHTRAAVHSHAAIEEHLYLKRRCLSFLMFVPSLSWQKHRVFTMKIEKN
jgi:hypothetical protein